MIVVATSVVGWFDRHQGFATALVTTVLVLVTMYYAKQNRDAVNEMRTARKLSVMPKLALEFAFFGPMHVNVAVKNIGPGVALDLDVSLIYEPIHPSHGTAKRQWRRSVLASGEQREFGLPDHATSNIDVIARTYKTIRLTGSMKDATGATHNIDDALDDLAEWRQILEQASERWTQSPDQRLADALAGQFQPDLRNLTKAVDNVTGALLDLRPLPSKVPRSWLRKMGRK